ncbi:L-lysine 4-hydroxylase [Frankliniella fusca]|uniref:L-lysine 4-hydroxylase n=1 Tax=Frankliniella fusca TaxID=407009 RepID=A0AAE1LQK5_9NEOP|nr:L-lysine 4-hydroxylase [Frankliniella fusca]
MEDTLNDNQDLRSESTENPGKTNKSSQDDLRSSDLDIIKVEQEEDSAEVKFHKNNPMWKEIMVSMNCIIDHHILQLLQLNGFGSYQALKEMDSEDIKFIEEFVRNGAILNYVDDSKLNDFIGPCKDPQKFSFLPGERKLILKIIEYVSKNHTQSDKSIGKKSLLQYSIFNKHKSNGNSLAAKHDGPAAKKTKVDFVNSLDVPQEVVTVRRILADHCKKKLVKKTVDTDTKTYLKATIPCAYCKRPQSAQRLRNETWNTSNVYRHWKTHVGKETSSLDSFVVVSENSSCSYTDRDSFDHTRDSQEDNSLLDKESNETSLDSTSKKVPQSSSADLTIVESGDVTLRSNEEIIQSLSARCEELSVCVSDINSNKSNLPFLLNKLMETAMKNSAREKHGRRYDNDLKYFAVYLFIVAGRFTYEWLYENLKPALPSLSQVERILASTSGSVTEGKFRFQELNDFLESKNLPKKVFISEDATRIIQKFAYDLTSDQIIGPVPPLAQNGVPIINSFPASSAAMIATHFDKNVPSSSAYAIMAQPLQDGSPTFCLNLFETDNKFEAFHVLKRWHFIHAELLKWNIEVTGFAADGDPKVLSAMQSHMFSEGPPGIDDFKEFYFARPDMKYFVLQDFIHTVNKFRHRLSPAVYLPIGNYVASPSHLRVLMDERSKDEHLLTSSDLDKDKMNFNSSIKICSENVRTVLSKHIPGSDGTVAYLQVMNCVMEAGLNQNLSPLEKLYKIWYSTFFLRLWRQWLITDPRFNLNDNFITRNLYICVEILAHSLVGLVMKAREEDSPDYLLFHLCTSQPCEAFFRLARSMTSTESTVINFTMKDFLHKVKRIDVLLLVSSKLDTKLEFPREKRKRLLGLLSEEKLQSTYIPSNAEIKAAVLQAKFDAFSTLHQLGISRPPNFSPETMKSCLLTRNVIIEPECDNNDSVEGTYVADIDEDDIPIHFLQLFPSPDIACDLDPHGELPETDNPYERTHVYVPEKSGGYKGISKSLLCYLLSTTGSSSISNIRLHRVREKVIGSLGNKASQPVINICKSDDISVGDWCIFKVRSRYLFMQVLSFRYITGKNLSFSLLSAPVNPPGGKRARGINCLGNLYVLDNGYLRLTPSQHSSVNINMYIVTVPSPIPDTTGSLSVPTSVINYVAELSQ